MHTITKPGDPAGVYVARWGTQGPGVVLVHGGVQGGLAAGERNFAYQKPLADAGWQLIVPDRPGHGQSPNPGRGDDAQADGLWIADLLGEGAHLVGHSFGAMAALHAASLRPTAVMSLTLIEPAALQIATSSPDVRRFLLRMAWAMWTSFSPATRARRAMRLLGIPPMQVAPNAAQLARQGEGLRRMRRPSKATVEHELDAVRQADIPLLVISGGWSPAFDATCAIVATRGGGRHLVFPSPHHFPQWTGKSFNDVLTGFWEESKPDQ
jgi:pimeloyl-ACP methyl ester carboxylesterase